jgi:hypothetical protein
MPQHVTINCATEGCYAIITLHPDDERRLRRTHEPFYCPAGHGNHFAGKAQSEKERDELRQRIDLLKRCLEEWRERWEGERKTSVLLTHGVQVCPLGCGWVARRRLPWRPEEREVARFLDRVWLDLTEHLLREHNATRKPIALLAERAQT